MKYYILILFFFSTIHCFVAQNITPDLKKGFSLLDSAKTTSDFKKANFYFEKACVVDSKNWLNYYYVGLCNTIIAFSKKGKEIDFYCDIAEKFTLKADSLDPNNSEVFVLKSMIAAARIGVNKGQRAQKYGSLSAQLNVTALKLDSNNPRANLQKARAILNMPTAFGGGEKKAKPLYETAIQKFNTFKPKAIYYPNWGLKEAETELNNLTQK